MGIYRVSIDMLVLSFWPAGHYAGADLVFIGFDGYTSSRNWERTSLVVPEISAEAAVRYRDPNLLDSAGIGPDDRREVQYSYSADNSLLLLAIGRGTVSRRIRCLSCVVAGLAVGGELLELWIEGLMCFPQR
jgi:hypothetical protein